MSRSASTSGRVYKAKYRGTSQTKGRNCWLAHCKKIYIGCFKTAEKAGRAYDKMAREIYGADAKLNFPIL